MTDLTIIYSGADLPCATNGVAYLPIVRDSVLSAVKIKTDAVQTGAAVFEVRRNGAVLSGLNALTIPDAAKTGSVTGLAQEVTDGDEITLNLVSGSVSSPIALTLVALDGGDLVQNTAVFSTGSISDSVTENINAALGKVLVCWRVNTSRAARLRAYSTGAYRTADAARPIGTDAVGESGLLLEVVTTAGNLTIDAAQAAVLTNGDVPPTSTIYFAVQNRSGAASVITATLTKLTLEN